MQPSKITITLILVWEIWEDYKDQNLTDKHIWKELCRGFGTEELILLKINFPLEYQEFIQIIQKFIEKARIRDWAIQECNWKDQLRLQWFIFKREIKKWCTRDHTPLDCAVQRNEEHKVLCSRVINEMIQKENAAGV